MGKLRLTYIKDTTGIYYPLVEIVTRNGWYTEGFIDESYKIRTKWRSGGRQIQKELQHQYGIDVNSGHLRRPTDRYTVHSSNRVEQGQFERDSIINSGHSMSVSDRSHMIKDKPTYSSWGVSFLIPINRYETQVDYSILNHKNFRKHVQDNFTPGLYTIVMHDYVYLKFNWRENNIEVEPHLCPETVLDYDEINFKEKTKNPDRRQTLDKFFIFIEQYTMDNKELMIEHLL